MQSLGQTQHVASNILLRRAASSLLMVPRPHQRTFGIQASSADTVAALAAANTSDKDLEDLVSQIQALRAQEETVRKRKEDLMAFLSLKMLKQRQQRALEMRQQMMEEKKAAAAAVAAAAAAGSTTDSAAPSIEASSSLDDQTPMDAELSDAERSIAASMSEGEDYSSSMPSASVEPIMPASTRTGPAVGLPSRRRKGSKRSKAMMAMAAAAGVLKLPSESRDTMVDAGSRTDSFITPGRPGTPSSKPPSRPASAEPAALVNPAPDFNIAGPDLSPLGKGRLENDPDDLCLLPKPIFIISDCTGESAARTVRAGLGQFELAFKMSCPANLVVFRFLNDPQRAYDIIAKAAEEDALVVYTLVSTDIIKSLRTACQLYNVPCVDLWSPLLDSMELHLQSVRKGVPLSSVDRRSMLSGDYFRFIEAVEYTRKMDDGANPQNWHQADLLILGVSRSGKTPLSIYLGQRGYKVANLPLVPNAPIPKELFEIDQNKIVGLLIDGVLLASIRRTRVGSMGLDELKSYTNTQGINEELKWAQGLYAEHPEWPVIDVTFRGVEETAARILAILDERSRQEGKLAAVLPFSV